MADSSIEQLVESFRKFPGIGPRQAQRFVYFFHKTMFKINNVIDTTTGVTVLCSA